MVPISAVSTTTADSKAAEVPSPAGHCQPHTAASIAEAMRSVVRPTAMDSLDRFLGVAANLAGCDEVSITGFGPKAPLEVLAAGNEKLRGLAQQEIDLGDGPSLESARTTFTVVEADLRDSRRWPQWTAVARREGVEACLAMHLFADTTLGAIAFYSSAPKDYTHHDLDTALTLAAHASLLVAGVRTEQHLWRAIDARNLIGQAQGILMHRYKLTGPAAFDLLTRTSQNSNRKLSTVASDLIATGQL